MRIRFAKKGILALLLAALLLTLAACGNGDPEPAASGNAAPGADAPPAFEELLIGGRITKDFADMTVEGAGTADKFSPSAPDGMSFSRVPAEGETFFYVTGTVKNTGGDTAFLTNMYINLVFDGKYNYPGSILGDTGRDLYGDQLKPLASVRYYIYASVPDELIASWSTCKVQFAFNDGFASGRKRDFGVYAWRYEISLTRQDVEAMIAAATEVPGPEFTPVEPGGTASADFVEMTVERADTADSLHASDPGTFSVGLAAPEGKRYFYLTGIVKNTGGDSFSLGFGSMKILLVFDGQYEYSGSLVTDTGSDLDTFGKRLSPMDSVRYYIYAAVPDEVLQSWSECRVQFAFHDGMRENYYEGSFGSYEHRYEITVTRPE